MAKKKIKVNTEVKLSSRQRIDKRPSMFTENVILADMRDTNLLNELGPKRVCTHVRRLYLKYWIEEFENWLLDGNEYRFIYKQILMRIVNRDTKSKKFKYNIKTAGLDPILFIKISTRMFYHNKRYYLAKVKGSMKERLDELTQKGFEFISLKDSGYVNFK